ncbi:MAG: TIGR00725 family protein [Candidatus Zixiibacteriota bacterium]
MSVNRKPVIAVVGANKCSKKLRDMAAEVGRYVAENGGIIVCGGLGGIMEGAAQGAREAGGTTIGIIPGDNPNDANEFIDIVIPTGIGEARNALVVRTADAVIAFPGKYGTLSEMAFTLQAGKPLISVNAWSLGDDVVQATTPREAAEMAMKMAKERR